MTDHVMRDSEVTPRQRDSESDMGAVTHPIGVGVSRPMSVTTYHGPERRSLPRLRLTITHCPALGCDQPLLEGVLFCSAKCRRAVRQPKASDPWPRNHATRPYAELAVEMDAELDVMLAEAHAQLAHDIAEDDAWIASLPPERRAKVIAAMQTPEPRDDWEDRA